MIFIFTVDGFFFIVVGVVGVGGVIVCISFVTVMKDQTSANELNRKKLTI